MSRHTIRNNYRALEIGIASPETIIKWSYGEVNKPETINYKTLKPEKGGLFDEVTFGPVKDYECACGKYKKIKNKGKVCEKCGVEVTESIVRRERMGHIELVVPVTHIWMLKSLPSKIALVLAMKVKEVEQIAYFVSHVVIKTGDEFTSKLVKKHQVLDLSDQKKAKETRIILRKILKYISEEKVQDGTFAQKRSLNYFDRLQDSTLPFSIEEVATFIEKHTGLKMGIGAEALEELLKAINLNSEYEILKNKILSGKDDTKKIVQRLEIIKSFIDSGNKPEWMIMRNIPVTPPESRPIIQLDGGRFTTSDLNDLYRRIIIRNERLKKAIEMGAPSIIINNEKRMLQEAVDALIDNSRRSKPLMSKDRRPFKSLTDYLKGKQGRFRQNLLGKRADYSARSVIAVGPTLKMYQCGIPSEMAVQLFKPFIIQKLLKEKLATNIRVAEKIISSQDDRIWPVVEEVLKERPVILNRAPTLHRLGIQAFEPILIDGKAIQLHPLVTPAFNADFDGDQMAVHLPLSKEAVAEARSILLASWHILGPKDGKPIVTPTQDMVLGNYYLTIESKGKTGEGMIFDSVDGVKLALQAEKIHVHTFIAIKTSALEAKGFKQGGYLITTAGKVVFNDNLPSDYQFINEDTPELGDYDQARFVEYGENIRERIESIHVSKPFKKKYISLIIEDLYNKYPIQVVAKTMDAIKDLGFKYSTQSGTTVSAFDVPVYNKKKEYFIEADKEIIAINWLYAKGLITANEKHQKVVAKWTAVKDRVSKDMEEITSKQFGNPIFMMSDSGARGNISNFTQLAGMRGLMSNPRGETIELPIKSSFRDGLSVSEYFISTHGARKGMADTALKTADSGYLTRRLVDVAQDCIVTEHDCKSEKGLLVSDIKDTKSNTIIEPLRDRLNGRFVVNNVYNPKTKKLIVDKHTLITPKIAKEIEDSGVKKLEIRSVLTCTTQKGTCQKCFGSDLSTRQLIEIGSTVGIIAAQSIGEPGTQLTMRTFHTGGVAGEADITQGLPRIKELLDVTKPKGRVAIISEIAGKITSVKETKGKYEITVTNDIEEKTYITEFSPVLRVKQGDSITIGAKLTDGSIDLKDLSEITDVTEVQNYIVKEVQKVYRLQGIEVADKYIEIIINQMLNKVIVVAPGDTPLIIGDLVKRNKLIKINQETLIKGGQPAHFRNVILGIKKAPLESDSFLSAASFQDTTRVLAKAAIKGSIDPLLGLKENVILGKLIPAGTGLKTSEEIIAKGNEMYELEY